eukprot:Hpha_TRINITY_DN15557_c3_g4::TRINITY_DN15557_c3_g4_i1::g.104688::m.104688
MYGGLPQKKFKLVLLGEQGVGKSSIVLRLTKNEYVEHDYATVGAAFQKHVIPLDDVVVMYDIWDTAGQERYRSLATMYYRGAAAALVVYDVTSADSFERAKYWIQELNTKAGGEEIVICLTANKCDVPDDQRVISQAEGSRLADEQSLLFFECSAKSGANVQNVFRSVSTVLARRFPAQDAAPADPQRIKPGVGGGGRPKGSQKRRCTC